MYYRNFRNKITGLRLNLYLVSCFTKLFRANTLIYSIFLIQDKTFMGQLLLIDNNWPNFKKRAGENLYIKQSRFKTTLVISCLRNHLTEFGHLSYIKSWRAHAGQVDPKKLLTFLTSHQQTPFSKLAPTYCSKPRLIKASPT